MRRAAERTATIRTAYVQSDILFGIGGGIQLADLRDLVAATDDYHPFSRVVLESQRVTVTETLQSPWQRRGRIEGRES